MRERIYVLSTRATGLGPLTKRCRERLREQLCTGCGARLAGTDLDLELEPPRADVITQALELANEGTDSEPVAGVDVPLNFVHGTRAHVIRADLLALLSSRVPDSWHTGSVRIVDVAELDGYRAVQDPDPIRIRGSKRPRINVCGSCGRFLPWPGGDLYVLHSDRIGDSLRQSCGAGSFVTAGDLNEVIAPLDEVSKRALPVDALPVLTDPLDGLPRELPTTWEEYESLMGPAADFPKQVWKANPRHVIGPWAARRIAERGMGSYFKRPDIRDLAIKLAVDGDEVRQTLDQWPEVRDEVLRYYDQHRSELQTIAEWRPD